MYSARLRNPARDRWYGSNHRGANLGQWDLEALRIRGTQRVRHPLHSLCPYFAMFPEDFVAKQVFAYTERGDVIFDPFCGRGTTVFESLLNHRLAYGVDINPVAACIAGAKADVPTLPAVRARIEELFDQYPNHEP